jgi:hypothetical protein
MTKMQTSDLQARYELSQQQYQKLSQELQSAVEQIEKMQNLPIEKPFDKPKWSPPKDLSDRIPTLEIAVINLMN